MLQYDFPERQYADGWDAPDLSESSIYEPIVKKLYEIGKVFPDDFSNETNIHLAAKLIEEFNVLNASVVHEACKFVYNGKKIMESYLSFMEKEAIYYEDALQDNKKAFNSCESFYNLSKIIVSLNPELKNKINYTKAAHLLGRMYSILAEDDNALYPEAIKYAKEAVELRKKLLPEVANIELELKKSLVSLSCSYREYLYVCSPSNSTETAFLTNVVEELNYTSQTIAMFKKLNDQTNIDLHTDNMRDDLELAATVSKGIITDSSPPAAFALVGEMQRIAKKNGFNSDMFEEILDLASQKRNGNKAATSQSSSSSSSSSSSKPTAAPIVDLHQSITLNFDSSSSNKGVLTNASQKPPETFLTSAAQIMTPEQASKNSSGNFTARLAEQGVRKDVLPVKTTHAEQIKSEPPTKGNCCAVM